jgi:nucleoside triphosphatase
MDAATERRIIVVGLVRNAHGEWLLCRMPPDRGVFPGQWGLPGGGIEPGEEAEAALRRELREEIGLEVSQVEPLFFTDGLYTKRFSDGTQRPIYMIFLLYTCLAPGEAVRLNPEFEAYAWVSQASLPEYDLNIETRKTFARLGWLPSLQTSP